MHATEEASEEYLDCLGVVDSVDEDARIVINHEGDFGAEMLRILMPALGGAGFAAPTAAACACGASMLASSLPAERLGWLGDGVVLTTAAAAVGASVGLLLWMSERKWAWLRLLWLGLFWTRLDEDEVEGHGTRARLLMEIRARPGQDTIQLAESLGVNTGTLLYHLRVLERTGHVTSRRHGRLRVWSMQGVPLDPKRVALQHPSRQALWQSLRDMPGLSTSQAAQRLGLSHSTVHHHVAELARAGLVRIERNGARTRLFAND